MNAEHCLNCNADLVLGQKFCLKCGQATVQHRFTLTHFFHEGFHAFTHTDKGIFFLLKELALRPGKVVREYIGGKRKKYFNPFTFFLLLATLFVFSNSFVGTSEATNNNVPESINNTENPEVKSIAMAQYERAIKVAHFTKKHGNVLSMIAVPFLALFFWLVFYRKSYNYAEHLVANLMFVGFSNLAFTILVFPLQAISKNTIWVAFIPLLGLVIQFVYYTIAYKGFMQLSGFGRTLKIAFYSLLAIILWVILSMLAMAVYVYQDWHFYEFFSRMAIK
ncbi:DUF3667 domain-containing protein [Pedobacter namyangjuensis]|uniref:DUF3667 domain-containing protein n=1 Tax=Pedobacter namyangjuensis TaxID=600626 RepID=UPI000DE20106|nr:DUF3667 domain-containing protein [Pedobacter namyangjuensis]